MSGAMRFGRSPTSDLGVRMALDPPPAATGNPAFYYPPIS